MPTGYAVVSDPLGALVSMVTTLQKKFCLETKKHENTLSDMGCQHVRFTSLYMNIHCYHCFVKLYKVNLVFENLSVMECGTIATVAVQIDLR